MPCTTSSWQSWNLEASYSRVSLESADQLAVQLVECHHALRRDAEYLAGDRVIEPIVVARLEVEPHGCRSASSWKNRRGVV